jgi:hypothetical protein
VALARQAQEWEFEKTELTARNCGLQRRRSRRLEREAALAKELNRWAAETASKQQLDGTKKVRCRVEEGGKGANLDVVDIDSWPMGASARQRKGMME